MCDKNKNSINPKNKIIMKKIFFLCALYASVLAANATEGALSGKFTINADGDQIVFSQGNLQATTTDLGENWTWSFATNQWDYIGDAAANNAINGNGTVSANGTVDLFGWSTDATYYGINNSTDFNSDYSGDFVEWGNNSISNGGNKANMWHTLDKDEWEYLFQTRTEASNKYGAAKVNGKTGVVLLPDDWTLPSGCGFTPGMTSASSWDDWSFVASTNIYEGQAWVDMENNGAVFLPAAGYRYRTDLYGVGSYGLYWSASPFGTNDAYYLGFGSDDLGPQTGSGRSGGQSVRLVQAAPKVPQTKEMTPTVAHLNWDETEKQWSITAYEYAGEDPKFVFVVAADGVKTTMPNSMVLTNSTNDNYVFSYIVNPEDFEGTIKDATISITYEGTGYKYDNVGGMYYVNAKISGEMSDADGNKLIVNEPADFIKLFVPSDVATGVDEILKSSNTEILKFVRDGQILIIRDNKIYTLQGQEIE